MGEHEISTSSEIPFSYRLTAPEDWEAFEAVTEEAEMIVSVDNLRDYSGVAITALFGLGIIAGMLFGKFSSWRDL